MAVLPEWHEACGQGHGCREHERAADALNHPELRHRNLESENEHAGGGNEIHYRGEPQEDVRSTSIECWAERQRGNDPGDVAQTDFRADMALRRTQVT